MSFSPVLLLFLHLCRQVTKKEKEKNGKGQAEGTLMICDLCWTNSQIFNPSCSSPQSHTTSRMLPPTIICMELVLTTTSTLTPTQSPFLCYLAHTLFLWSVFILSGFFYKLSPATFPTLVSTLSSQLFLFLYILSPPPVFFPLSLLPRPPNQDWPRLMLKMLPSLLCSLVQFKPQTQPCG